MYNKKLSDESFESLTLLIIKFNNTVEQYLSSVNCLSNVHILPMFHKVFEKQISKKQLKELTDRPLKNKIFNTYHNRLIFLLILEACARNRDIVEYLKCIGYMNYIILFKKYIPYCDEHILLSAVTSLKTTHNLRKFSSPKLAIDTLSENLQKKYYRSGICSIEIAELLLIHIRTRIARSLKSLVTKYLRTKRESKVFRTQINVDVISDKVATRIVNTGYIPKIDMCSQLYDKLEKIKNLEYDEIFTTIQEIILLVGTSPSKKKIIGQMKNMISLQKLMNKLQIPINTKTVACTIYTLLQAGGLE